ncbi:MAG TPA: (2Fe-2S)-binding protein [Myxococcota bacterium]|nr:(2Fe-2S)-binding protein [Myxococcota bacterium]
MIVCLCKVVSDREIEAAIDEGHTTLKAIARTCGAGTGPGCGACRPAVMAMVQKRTGCRAACPAHPAQSADSAADVFPLASLALNR